jgi:DNA-binding XRE family transcriptional regulator
MIASSSMSRPLTQYLLTHRKRAGLSQRELAFLLGSRSGTKVSRHEQERRQPSLRAALAYAAVYRVPVEELFPGLALAAELKVVGRKQALLLRLRGAGEDPATAWKRTWLRTTMAKRSLTRDHRGEDV